MLDFNWETGLFKTVQNFITFNSTVSFDVPELPISHPALHTSPHITIGHYKNLINHFQRVHANHKSDGFSHWWRLKTPVSHGIIFPKRWGRLFKAKTCARVLGWLSFSLFSSPILYFLLISSVTPGHSPFHFPDGSSIAPSGEWRAEPGVINARKMAGLAA